MTDNKNARKEKADFDLHVLLIMKEHQVTKTLAQVRAYHEGWAGLSERLQPTPSLFTEEPAKK